MMKLRVRYFYDGINEELDKKIIQLFGNLGFEWDGQGYDLEQGMREIFFINPSIKEEKENERKKKNKDHSIHNL